MLYVRVGACVYVYMYMRMYLHVSCAYIIMCISFFRLHMCKNACICMYHVCMSAFCMYLVCIMYVCVCIACIGPDQHSYTHYLAKRPAPGPGTRRPHSEQHWAGAHHLYSAIHDPPPDPIWRTPARSTRRGGPTRVHGVANRPPVRIHPSENPTEALSKLIWLVGAAPRGHPQPLPA